MPPRKIKTESIGETVRSTILQPEVAAELDEIIKLKKKESAKRRDGKKAPKVVHDKTTEDAHNILQVAVNQRRTEKSNSADNSHKRPSAEVSGPSSKSAKKAATQHFKAPTFASNDLPTILEDVTLQGPCESGNADEGWTVPQIGSNVTITAQNFTYLLEVPTNTVTQQDPGEVLSTQKESTDDEQFQQIHNELSLLGVPEDTELLYDQSPEYNDYLRIDHSDVSEFEQQDAKIPATPRANLWSEAIPEQFYIQMESHPEEYAICSRLKSLYSQSIAQELEDLKLVKGRIQQVMENIINIIDEVRKLM